MSLFAENMRARYAAFLKPWAKGDPTFGCTRCKKPWNFGCEALMHAKGFYVVPE